jgi:peroxiredoxin Q/BCP
MKTRLLLLAAGLAAGCTTNAEPIDVGAKAPAVAALDQNGKSVDLGALYQTGFVLVYFYPKADTGGCTAQACSLRDDYEKLQNLGVTVVGVSTDDVAAQKAFAEKYHLPFTLLADTGKKVIDGFGVPLRGAGFATRQAFLMRNGVVVWRDLTASTAEQAADVLAALAELNAPAKGA